MTRRRRRRSEDEADIEHRLDNEESEEEISDDLAGQVYELERKTDDVLSKVGLALADIRIISDKVKRFEDVITDVNELADELDEKLEKLDETEAKLDKIIKESGEVKSKIENLEETKSSLLQTIDEVKRGGIQAGEGTDQISEASLEQIDTLRSQLNELTIRVEETYASMGNIEDLKDLLARHTEELRHLTTTVEKIKQEGVTAAEGGARSGGETQIQIQELRDLLEEKDSGLRESIAEINERLEQDLAEIAPLIEKVSESAGVNVKEASERIGTLEQKLNTLSESVQIDELVKKIDAVSTSINAEEISGRFSSLGQQLTQNKAELDEKIRQLGESVGSGVTERLQASMQESQRAFGEKVVSLSDAQRKTHDEIEALKEQYEKVLQTQDEGIEKAKEEFQKAFEQHKSEVKELSSRLQSVLDSSEGINKVIEEANSKVAEVSEKIKGASENYEQLTESLNEAAEKSGTSLDKVNLAFRLVEDMENKLRRIAAPVDDLIERIEEFEDLPEVEDLGFDLNDLLNVMLKHQASDLHIKEGAPPTVRLEGDLVPVGDKILTDVDCRYLVLSSLTKGQRRRLMEKKELDYAYSIPEGRFRVNSFIQKGSLSAAFRMLKTEIPTIEELNLPPFLKKLASVNHGLILITGPAGCGKSTTLASMIDHINANRKVHIITIEDPIEFVHHDKLSIVTQRELGSDTTTFQDALKGALRQDPNVILIGEMRDAETILTAAIAAETGHLVLSTLHTPNTTQAVERIIDVFSGDQQKQFRLLLSTTLRAVISQRLLSRIDADGRVPATEIMVVTPTVSSLIREGKTNEIYPLMVQGATEGMQTFTASLTRLYEAGLISKEDALFHADQPTEFRLGIEGHTSGAASIPEDSLMSWL